MSRNAGAVRLQQRLADKYKHPSDLDTSGSQITLPSDAFTFVTVPDHFRALLPLAVVQHPRDEQLQCRFIDKLASAYDRFVSGTLQAIRESGNSSGKQIKVCALDLAEVTAGVRGHASGAFTVSLNEGDAWADFSLGLSRLFSLGGGRFFTHTSRPGSDAIDEQLRALKGALAERGISEVVLVDDHAFSGKTIESVVSLLRQQEISVKSVTTYTRVNSLKLDGIEVKPVKGFVGDRILERADLVEPRYFLIGSAGCVVELPNKKLARAPYVLPFGSPVDRASIPANEATPFSRRLITLNQGFFRAWAEVTGKEPVVADLDPLFGRLMVLHGFDEKSPVQGLLASCSERLEHRINRRTELERVQSDLRPLGLPQDIVFLDINDTILKSGDSEVNALVTEQLQRRIRKLQDLGVSVGLCSDSPLPQMINFAAQFGITGPIIAENGNIISNSGKKTILRRLENIDALRDRINQVASRRQLTVRDDRVAVEFGGSGSRIETGTYSFGRDRQTSISVFGDVDFIEDLKREFEDEANLQTFGVDASPRAGIYGFFAMHPCPIRSGKADTLRMLAKFGHRVTMIGNSMSDFVEPNGGVDVGMVGNHSLTDGQLAQCRYSTTVNLTLGVVNLLHQIEYARLKERQNGA